LNPSIKPIDVAFDMTLLEGRVGGSTVYAQELLAALAKQDGVRMEVISAFLVLRQGHEPSPELERELLDTVRRELGPVAVIGELNFVVMLPKTRSGKIMRRVLKAVTLDKDPGDISTIEDEGSVGEAREAWDAMRKEVGAN